jgi:hypothetical protein
VPHLYHYLIGFDIKIVVQIVVKIVVIVTVSFLNLFLPLNVVLFWYLDSLYACLGVHMLRIHCLMAMFATKNGRWIPPSKSSSNPRKTMDPRVRCVQNAIQGL